MKNCHYIIVLLSLGHHLSSGLGKGKRPKSKAERELLLHSVTNLFPTPLVQFRNKDKAKLDLAAAVAASLLGSSLWRRRSRDLGSGLGHHWCYPLKNAHHQQEIIFMPLASQGFEGHFNAFQRLHQKAIHKSFASVSQEYCYKKKAKRETCNFFSTTLSLY